MLIVFSDILFTMRRVSRCFEVRYFELSASLTDEATFTSGGAFFDWLTDHPVFMIPVEKRKDVGRWLSMTDWIEARAALKYRNMMLRNQWQNFFLGLESELRNRLEDNDIRTISSGRKIFDGFCRLLYDNCRKHHDVQFYADKLCITPYYLSLVTRRVFDVSPKELIDRQIVMEIKSLLTSTELTIKEIAAQYNFESSSYLGRYFRRHTGMTPLQYRQLH